MHFDSQKHDFNFGQKNAYHIIFISENCMICFFHKQKHRVEVKKFLSFFGCQLAVVLLKYKFLQKKILHGKLDFLCLKRSPE